MSVLVVAALLETAWTIYLGWRLPRHYTADHWDLAWVGMDVAQVATLLATAWAAWRRRAILVAFAVASATLVLVDAWFDVMTARYGDLDQSLTALAFELPWAVALLWIARRVFTRLAVPLDPSAVHSVRRLEIPRVYEPPDDAGQG